MLWTLFEICINAYQAFLMIYFLRHRLTPIASIGYRDTLCIIGVTAFFSLYLFIELPIADTFVFIIPFLYSIGSFTEKWYMKGFWVLVLATLMISVVNFTISIFSSAIDADWSDIMMHDSALRFSFILASNIALTVAIFIISKITHTQGSLSRVAILLVFFQNVAHILILEFLFSCRYSTMINDIWFLIACLAIFICSYMSYAIYEILSVNAQKEHLFKQQLQMLEVNAQHQEDLKSIYSQVLIRQHDLKHLLQTLDLMQQNPISIESSAIIDDIKKGPLLCEFSTGNITVDALLAAKQNIMKQKGITFCYSIHPLSYYPLSNTQLCIVLGNLLDNAIEGIERIPKDKLLSPKIMLTLEQAWNMFYISCENPVDISSLKLHDNKYISSKKPSSLHGYGLYSIRSIVSEADGDCKISVQNSLFVVRISIPS